jgi:NAD(P)H-dependent FMN reductase
MLRIAVVTGSTRPNRRSPAVAAWVVEQAMKVDAPFDVVDLEDFALPLLDEPQPAAQSADYRHSHTKRWAETIGGYDGFVFVTPEYNHSVPAALKNAMDYLYREWNNKVAGIVTYGGHGGVRAGEHLRLNCSALQMATVGTQVSLSLFEDFAGESRFEPRPHHSDTVLQMVDEVMAWGTALRELRLLGEPPGPTGERVLVVGRAPWKMREALRVLRGHDFSAVGVLDEDAAVESARDSGDLLAVVLGGSVGPELEHRLRELVAPNRANIVRTAIGHGDPARHFADEVVPQLETLRQSQHDGSA